MISNRCARKSLVTNCNSIISKNYLRFLVDSNDIFHNSIRYLRLSIKMKHSHQTPQIYYLNSSSHVLKVTQDQNLSFYRQHVM